MKKYGAKGYKAFDHGMTCRGKQYAEDTVFEENGANSCCKVGVMHYCENPLYVLNYYPLIDNEGRVVEVAEVEPMAEVLHRDDKCATKKLKIGAKLNLKDFIKASIEFVFENCKAEKSSGNSAQLASSGDSAQLASSGDFAKLASSGDSAQLASSGDYAQLASSGNHAQLASSGDYAQLASSGDYAQLASSGNLAHLASSGNSAQLASSGDYAKLASSGDSAQLASSGDSAKLASSGKYSVVAGIGGNNIAKTALGNWIVLAEWAWDEDGNYTPKCVKAVQVDGDKIKADTWYKLDNGEFVEI